MIKIFLIQAFRNLSKQRQTTMISIIGLVIALSVILQIANWCRFELSYDRYNSKAERIYRFTVEENRPEENFYWHFARSWQTWRTKLPEFYPEIESLVELRPMWRTIVKIQNNLFYNNNVFTVDSNVFNVFDFEFITGNPETAINGENTVVVSESFAKKHFPGQDAINRELELYGGDLNGFEKHTITGIFKNFPGNSHFHVDMLVHYKKKPAGGNDFAYTYILLKEGTDIDQVKSRSNEFIKTHVPESQQKGSIIHYTPLTDIHLKSHIEREIEINGDLKQVKLFLFIGLGILIIALINYINLLVTSFEKRLKNFNINMTVGAKQKHNVLMLFIESLIIALAVLTISAIVLKPLSFFLVSTGVVKADFFSINIVVVLTILLFFILVILSGVLPIYIVKLNPSGFFSKHATVTPFHHKSSAINNPLLVLQFAVSIIVVISSLMLNKQNNFLSSKNLGNNTSNIIMVPRSFWAEEPDVMLFKEELLKTTVVEDVTMCMDPPGHLVKDARRVEYANIPEENKKQIITILPVDCNFFSFFDIPLVAGGEKEYITKQPFENYILNESAIKKLGFTSALEAIGTNFKIDDFNQGIIKGGTITGVVRDFSFASLYNPIEPTIYFQKPIWQWRYLIRTDKGDQRENIAQVKKVWDKIFPDYPFDYQYLDNVYEGYYSRDIITNKLVGWFSIICIILSIIGLWGISSILVIRKTKEIGVRKVNGARYTEILAMLNRDFVKWVVLAYLVAVPVAWYFIRKWLENYAFKTEISWWIFALAGFLALGLSNLPLSISASRSRISRKT